MFWSSLRCRDRLRVGDGSGPGSERKEPARQLAGGPKQTPLPPVLLFAGLKALVQVESKVVGDFGGTTVVADEHLVRDFYGCCCKTRIVDVGGWSSSFRSSEANALPCS